MKKLLLFLSLCAGLFGADAANDLLITQRNSGNTGNVQRNITATTNTILGWNGTSLVNITAGTNITILAGVISATGGSGTPGGTNGQAQYNNGGSFGGYTVGGDATLSTATGVLTLATVNSTIGAFGSATQVATFTVNAKGLVTVSGNTTIALPLSAITQSGATTNQLPAWSGSAWVPTGSPVVNLLTRTGTSTNNAILGVLSDSTTYNVLTLNNVATMAGAVGMSGGGGSDTNLYLRVPTGGTVLALVNNVVVGGFSATGLNSTRIGITSAADAIFTTVSSGAASTSNSNLRTTKGNYNIQLNVKDYGALGDNSHDDTLNIAAAVTALPSTNAILYFPAGIYITDAISVSSKTGLTIYGDGMGSSTIKSRTGSKVLTVAVSTGVTVRGLTFDGNCSVRTAGQTAVDLDVSQNLVFTNNTIKNSGQYNVLVGGNSTQNTDINITNNVLLGGYADGINLQYVSKGVIADNTVDGVDDDCIAIGYNGSGFATQLTVIGNYCRARNDLGTNTGRGIWVGKAQDILIEGNTVDTIKQTGIWISDDGTGTRPARISVKGNKVRNVATSSGHGIAVYKTDYVTLESNDVVNPAQGSCIEIADWQHLSIKGGTLTQSVNVFGRGIHADESAGWAASWDDLMISNVDIRMLSASSDVCVYLDPHSSVTMNTGSITNVTCNQANGATYAFVNTARGGTKWKIGNNVGTGGATGVLPASSTGIFTVFNNN